MYFSKIVFPVRGKSSKKTNFVFFVNYFLELFLKDFRRKVNLNFKELYRGSGV
jgi:hypothetical protein